MRGDDLGDFRQRIQKSPVAGAVEKSTAGYGGAFRPGYDRIGVRDALVGSSHRQLGPLEGSLGLFAGLGEGHNFLVALGLQVDGRAKALFHIEAGLVVDFHHVALRVFEVNAIGNAVGDGAENFGVLGLESPCPHACRIGL